MEDKTGAKYLLTPLQLDALREIGNIGSGHAATALSQLISCPVHMQPPNIRLIEKDQLEKLLDDPEQVGVRIRILGHLRGDIFLLLSRNDAEKLRELMCGFGQLSGRDISLEAAISEMANIMAGAYSTALYEMSRLPILCSVPEILASKDLVSRDLESASLLIENYLNIHEFDFHNLLLLHPSPESLNLFLERIGVPQMEQRLNDSK
ncbi:MAG: chemotaxis protein CheC [Chloroflexi bacterium]|nr:chemotaxis protein CheC [Chloroflexota bacterium]